jgi:hypothetical protein
MMTPDIKKNPAILEAASENIPETEEGTGQGISEAASENMTPHHKRGRPTLISEEVRAVFNMGNVGELSERSKQNFYHAMPACSLLHGDPRFAWLTEVKPNGRFARIGILSELGRIDNDEDIIAAALVVSEERPKTKDAMVRIRRFRTGKAPAYDPDALAHELIRVLDTYVESHPGIPWEDVEAAVEVVLVSVQTAARENADILCAEGTRGGER